MIAIIFETDDYRGDHSTDVQYIHLMSENTTLKEILNIAEKHQTTTGSRATIKILPEIKKEQL